jgi:hypothetical protein
MQPNGCEEIEAVILNLRMLPSSKKRSSNQKEGLQQTWEKTDRKDKAKAVCDFKKLGKIRQRTQNSNNI